MEWLAHRFQEGGWPNWLLLLLGMLGGCVALVALVVPLAAKSRAAALWAGAASSVLGLTILVCGWLGMRWGQSMVTRAVANVTPFDRETLLRQGFDESRSPLEFALGFALLPLLCGAVALVVASLRRPSGEPPGVPLGMAAAGFVGLGAALLLHAQPLPGRDLTRDQWSVLRTKAGLDERRGPGACRDLTPLLQHQEPLSAAVLAMPELAEVVSGCAERWLAVSRTPQEDPEQPYSWPGPAEGLKLLVESGLPLAPELRARVEQRLAAR